MNLMSDGMAVAMYTTLAGLVGSILVRIQYYMLDDATAKLFAYAVGLTEVRVVSVLEGSGAILDVNHHEKSLLQTLRNPLRKAG